MPNSVPSKAHTVETFKPQPAPEKQLACPNPTCRRTDQLVLMERVTVSTPAEFWDVGVTFPEIDKGASAERVTPHGGRDIMGVRCEACRWSVSDGSQSLRALTLSTVA